MATIADKRAAFRTLHADGFFILPNAWDGGSATRLAAQGFRAIASTSAGAAWAAGKDDGEMSRDAILAHLKMLVAATDLPVNADFENGFADAPADVAANAVLAAETGIAGLSIEDWSGSVLYDASLAAERIRAAREALDPDVLLVGRAEYFRAPDLGAAAFIARAVAYSEAGADVLFVPFMLDEGAVAELIAAVAPKPVNVLVASFDTIPAYAALGTRRCSVGGALAKTVWNAFDTAAASLKSYA
ncbi:isocitrate lyase/PEP mutase family protein [Sphingomonas immobilis]|uniref:Isocitrate lyase/phosphoenolpyruvate mutase family protein n=1 Tax=Sphingomonas immobilis TaxID=3063997 RepID=A0ABT8ZUS0_9SPHN|nr:isocitrate lyase/phosphoenolpyruvate mutase family protein [Sphingomonas sp. CA1-15]MDO7841320.1 isocitrate lyase/phosphoenolpyruvate mutase family protein [Sphingomonas sp. CA1-15]